jgi:hypothetical protein
MRGSVIFPTTPALVVAAFYSLFVGIVERERSGANAAEERTPLISPTPFLLSPQLNGIDTRGSQYGSTIGERSL